MLVNQKLLLLFLIIIDQKLIYKKGYFDEIIREVRPQISKLITSMQLVTVNLFKNRTEVSKAQKV